MNIARVTRPVHGTGDKVVSLTATVSHGEVTKEYILTGTILEAELDSSAATMEDGDWITVPSETTTNISLPVLGPNGSDITWTSSDDSCIDSKGIVNRPTDADATITLTATVKKDEAVTTKTFTVKVLTLTAQEQVNIVARSINWNTIRNRNIMPNGVTTDLTLPQTGLYGTKIGWGVGDTYYINTNTGAITRPDVATGDHSETISARVTKNDTSGKECVASSAMITITILKLVPDTSAYLAGFVATVGQANYVDPATINSSDYWTADNPYGDDITDEYWTGRNDIVNRYIAGMSASDYTFSNSLKATVSDFDKRKFKLMKDVRGGLVLPAFENDFTRFSNLCDIDVASGGYGVTSLSRPQRIEIYLTYHLRVVVNVFDTVIDANKITSESLTTLVKYAKLKPTNPSQFLETLDWIDFNNVAVNPNVLGFNTDPETFRTKTFMNLEPSIYDFAWNGKVTQFKQLHGAPTGFGTIDYNGVTWDLGRTPDPFNIPLTPGDDLRLAQTFIHELGHSVDYNTVTATNATKMTYGSGWRNISGWAHLTVTTKWELPTPQVWAMDIVAGSPEPPVSLYGSTLVEEDFAEAFMMFYLNEDGMNEFWPKKYAYMKGIYAGTDWRTL